MSPVCLGRSLDTVTSPDLLWYKLTTSKAFCFQYFVCSVIVRWQVKRSLCDEPFAQRDRSILMADSTIKDKKFLNLQILNNQRMSTVVLSASVHEHGILHRRLRRGDITDQSTALDGFLA